MTSGPPTLDVDALGVFLAQRGVEVDGPLHADLIAGGRSNLTYRVSDGRPRWVVRRPPASGLTPSAHDMTREWTVIHALQRTPVPVPPAVALCGDPDVLGAPFTVTGYVPGVVIRTVADLAGYSATALSGCANELVRVLAELHRLDPAEVGLESFGNPTGYLERQVRLWKRQWEKVQTHDLPDLDRLHDRLAETVPTGTSRTAIVHGDYRVDNTILDPGDLTRVAAVLDWEMSTLGDPLADIALMCVYRQPALDVILGVAAAWTTDKFPSADDLAGEYAHLTGDPMAHWPWYLALANFKLAVIAEGISYRAAQGAAADDTAAAARLATPELIAAGLRAV